ncbi:hypothetical protein EG68_06021 [Paragonimus skrjabini miyazakii]|uniref:Mitochondrial proton/calcium exchanger protein n=1 Tax=Paragonimus skrjabini miyazakii TaxID=59628 RepID=A0A8S9YQ18_9TREM|nr:hypothetical protein EG68_06021 [Paragonimus skrjabini miyazakii]
MIVLARHVTRKWGFEIVKNPFSTRLFQLDYGSKRFQYRRPLPSLVYTNVLSSHSFYESLHTDTHLLNDLECSTSNTQKNKFNPIFLITVTHNYGPTKSVEQFPLKRVLTYSTASVDPPKTDPDKKKSTDNETRLTLWQRTKKEVLHYYHGFRLLGLEFKIASGICFRLLRGHTLTRRERKQLVRTVADIIRLVPFVVFIIVPFMEFLLPLYLKFFPFMLPSTFKDKNSEAEKLRQRLKAKLEMTRFLQETLHQTTSASVGGDGSTTVSEFQEFLKKVQESGQPASAESITRFSKLFEDQVTLDSLEVKQLKMLCQLLSLPTIGPSNLLRFQIWMRVRQLKAEDRLIAKEGVEQIPAWELQSLCQDRGMRSAGMTEEKLRFQLCQWLTLHLEKNVPVTLLLFSRAMHVTHALADELPLKEAIAQLPPSVSEEATARVLETTPHTELDPRTKMEVLRKEQASIKAERVQRKQELAKQKSASESEARPVPDVLANNEVMVDTAPTLKGLPKEDLLPSESGSNAPPGVSSKKPSITQPVAKVFSDTVAERTAVSSSSPTTTPEAHVGSDSLQSVVMEPIVTKAATKEEDTEISVEDLTQIETAIAESSNALNEEALHGLKEEVAETEKIQQKHEANLVSSEHVVDKRTSKAAALLAARVNRMIGEMDTMIIKVDEERTRLLRDIKAREANVMQLTEDGKQIELLDAIKADHQRVIDIGDLLAALKRLQKVPDDARWEKILEVLDEDHDGKIELQHILSAIELLGSEKITLNSKEVKRVLEMFDNELLAERIESNLPANDSTTASEPNSKNSQAENKSAEDTSCTSFPSPKPSVHSSAEAKMNPPASKS